MAILLRVEGKAMRAALTGITRSRFRATFSGVSPRGDIILQDIRSPRGRSEHLWVRFENWPGRMFMPGAEIAFSASARAYERACDNSIDLTLCDIAELEVI
jgi:hypothetical protein